MHNINTDGLLIGAATFVAIGVFHPLVIKAEYYLGVNSWWLFLLAGLGSLGGSLFVGNGVLSIILGVVGFSCMWSINEIFKQRKRVERGWFAAGPGHEAHKRHKKQNR